MRGRELAEQDLVGGVAGRAQGARAPSRRVAVDCGEVSTPFAPEERSQPVWSGSCQSDQRFTRGSAPPSTTNVPV